MCSPVLRPLSSSAHHFDSAGTLVAQRTLHSRKFVYSTSGELELLPPSVSYIPQPPQLPSENLERYISVERDVSCTIARKRTTARSLWDSGGRRTSSIGI